MVTVLYRTVLYGTSVQYSTIQEEKLEEILADQSQHHHGPFVDVRTALMHTSLKRIRCNRSHFLIALHSVCVCFFFFF